MIYAQWLVRLTASTKNNFQLLLACSQPVIPSMLYMTKCYFCYVTVAKEKAQMVAYAKVAKIPPAKLREVDQDGDR